MNPNNNNNKESFKALKLYRNKTVSNRVDEETYLKVKEILQRERKPVNVWLQEALEDFILKHGDGNPASTLDQFNDVNFIIMPQFYRPISIWEKYLTKCSKEEYKKYCARLESLPRFL